MDCWYFLGVSGLLKIIISLVAVIGLGVGVWLAAPLFYDKKVDEELPADFVVSDPLPLNDLGAEEIVDPKIEPGPTGADSGVVKSLNLEGDFRGADSFHRASGKVSILNSNGKRYARFEDDFSVTNGPDLFVYFGKDGDYDVDTNLGKLKGNKGSQNYEIPENIDCKTCEGSGNIEPA